MKIEIIIMISDDYGVLRLIRFEWGEENRLLPANAIHSYIGIEKYIVHVYWARSSIKDKEQA